MMAKRTKWQCGGEIEVEDGEEVCYAELWPQWRSENLQREEAIEVYFNSNKNYKPNENQEIPLGYSLASMKNQG